MKTVLALLLGAACAAVIACGGVQKAGKAPPTTSAVGPEAVTSSPGGGAPMPGERDPRIVALDKQIGADLEKLGLERPVEDVDACLMGACDRMSTEIKPRRVDDPTCVRGDSQTCQDSCTLSDSICDSAEKICRIAAGLGGEKWANERCASGNASCDKSRTKCCGCA